MTSLYDQTPMDKKMFFTVPDFAAMVGICSVTVYRGIKEGLIRGSWFGKHTVMISREELERFQAGEVIKPEAVSDEEAPEGTEK